VSPHIRDRDLEGYTKSRNRNRESPKREFLITIGVGPQVSEQRTGGIRDMRIIDPEDMSSTHISLAKDEFPIRGKRLWSCGATGHM
jgi:hypothetical protein